MKELDALERIKRHFFLIASSVLPAALGFFFLPIIVKEASVDQYARYVALQSGLLVLNVFAGFSSAGYVSNAHVEEAKRQIIFSSMICVLMISVPFLLIIAIFLDLTLVRQGWMATAVMVGYAIASYINSLHISFFVLKKSYIHLFIQCAVQLSVQYGLVIVFIVFGVVNATSLSVALLVGAIAGVMVCIQFDTGLVLERSSVKITEAKRIFSYGLPLLPHFLLSIAIGNFDRWYLSSLPDDKTLAQYSIAFTLAATVMMATDVYNKIYSPKVFDLLINGDHAFSSHLRVQRNFLFYCLVTACFAYLVGYWYIQLFIDWKYDGVVRYFVFMLACNFFFVIYYIAAPYIYFYNKSKYVLYSSLMGAMAILCLFLFVPAMSGVVWLIIFKSVGILVMGMAAVVGAWACFITRPER